MILILRLVDVHAVHGPDVTSVHCLESSVTLESVIQKRFKWKQPVSRQQVLNLIRAVTHSSLFLDRLVTFLSGLPFKRGTRNEFELRDAVGFKIIAHPCPLLIDRKWSSRLVRLVIIKMETDDILAMLSTLGGAYSCLGESDPGSAVTAGRIAVRQLSLSSMTGDPNLIARCWIYQVYSYCQRRMKRKAIRLMRLIHPILVHLKETGKCEAAVVKMYQAATHRIKHLKDLYNGRLLYGQ